MIGTDIKSIHTRFIKGFIDTHRTDIVDAKYKIGQCVTHIGGTRGVVLAVNANGDGIEYAVSNRPFLVWEDELILE